MGSDTIGNYDYIPDTFSTQSKLFLTTHQRDLLTYWKRCGMLSDYVGAYFTFPPDKKYFSDLSVILNELVENAAKFSIHDSAEIRIDIRNYGAVICLEVTNTLTKNSLANLKEVSARLFESDSSPEELYFKTLETKNSEDPSSGLGFLMILKDFTSKVGFKFTEKGEERTVTTRVYFFLNMDE